MRNQTDAKPNNSIDMTQGQPLRQILSQAELSLRCHFTALPFLGLVLALRTAMQSLGQKAAPVTTSALELMLKIISATMVIPAIGFFGVCLTEPVCWGLMAAFLIWIYLRSTSLWYLKTQKGSSHA